ncbi:MAG: PrsW family intramembrane metalloprotease [Chloroflexota bacterium]
MLILISIIMGILPMLVYALFIWWLDRWEKEPLHLIGAAFLWGFIPSAIFALIAQVILNIPVAAVIGEDNLAFELYSGSIIAPLTEEGIKGFAVFLIFIFFYKEFDSVMDGIVYGSLVGFGFAAIENILYFISASDDAAGLGCLIILRAFLFGLNHAFFTSLTGIGFALARYRRNILLKMILPLIGLSAAMMMHALHNAFATFGLYGLPFAFLSDWMGIIGVGIIALISLYNEGKWLRQYLADEVSLGTLTAQQAETASSFFRFGADFGSFFVNPIRWWRLSDFHHKCAELAYKKHQMAKMGNEFGNRSEVEKLRVKVSELSGQVER